jgi:hypothetical protein
MQSICNNNSMVGRGVQFSTISTSSSIFLFFVLDLSQIILCQTSIIDMVCQKLKEHPKHIHSWHDLSIQFKLGFYG